MWLRRLPHLVDFETERFFINSSRTLRVFVVSTVETTGTESIVLTSGMLFRVVKYSEIVSEVVVVRGRNLVAREVKIPKTAVCEINRKVLPTDQR